MNNNALKKRYIGVSVVLLALFLLMVFQLADLQLRQGSKYRQDSERSKTRTITLKGERGRILDTNGIPLAYDQKSYNVVFYRDRNKSKQADTIRYTKIIQKTIQLIEQNGDSVVSNFSIQKNMHGEHEFYWGNITDERAAALREANWRKNMQLPKDFVDETPDVIYWYLRNRRYMIPEDASDEEALKILSVWQEVQLTSYIAYLPVTIAKNVSAKTVAQIETLATELSGMQITEGTARIYPKRDVAAHILGYTGRIGEDQLTQYVNRKYSPEDWIGISGIEYSYEEKLTGNTAEHQGQRVVEVNNLGVITRELSKQDPSNGNDVMLTLDLNLQVVAENAMKKTIEKINQEQQEAYLEDKEKYDLLLANRADQQLKTANSGAAVVMEVNTGRTLAMVSLPSYDLMKFANGMSKADYDQLLSDERAPLFNKAISAKGTPGSIFKMVVGLAGLEEGVVTVDEVIDDEGYYNKYVAKGRGPSCWVRPNFHTHDNQDITKALANSCNYYFFEVADRLGVDRISQWSNKLGLTKKTNIELPAEQAGQVGNQDVLYNYRNAYDQQATAGPLLVHNQIVAYINKIGEEMGVSYDEDVVSAAVEKMMQYSVQHRQSGAEVRRLLQDDIGIPAAIMRSKSMDREISSMMVDLKWDPNQTIRVGIGQSLTTLTPIAVARYVSALVNGGIVYEAQLVKAIINPGGQVIEEKQPVIDTKLDVHQEYLEAIKHGMRSVVSLEDGGTAGKAFQNWKYRDQIGGKTGSAQVGKIDLETNSWFVAFAPYDKPEIAVVVFIPQGKSGTSSIPAIMEIIEYYLDKKQNNPDSNIPATNTLLP